jgi:two-component system LytT family response regulator
MIIKAIIIDDEIKSIKSLKIRIERLFDDIKVVATARSAHDGKEAIDMFKPDLVFLDIEMPNGNAFTLLERFDSIDFKIIFVTAHSEYALQAIKMSALDYILKPIDEDELVEAINKFKSDFNKSGDQQRIKDLTENYRKFNSQAIRIALPTMGGTGYVMVNKIIYCEADSNYSIIHYDDMPKQMISKTLKYLEETLGDFNFMRVHQSYLVNLYKVVRFEKSKRGRIVLSDGTTIGLSPNKKDEFLDRMSKLTSI